MAGTCHQGCRIKSVPHSVNGKKGQQWRARSPSPSTSGAHRLIEEVAIASGRCITSVRVSSQRQSLLEAGHADFATSCGGKCDSCRSACSSSCCGISVSFEIVQWVGKRFLVVGESPLAAPTLSLLPQASSYKHETVDLLNPFSPFKVYFRVSKGGPVAATYVTSEFTDVYSLGNCKKSTCTGDFTGDPGPTAYSISVTIEGYNLDITGVSYT